jgi:hypothetical protein
MRFIATATASACIVLGLPTLVDASPIEFTSIADTNTVIPARTESFLDGRVVRDVGISPDGIDGDEVSVTVVLADDRWAHASCAPFAASGRKR